MSDFYLVHKNNYGVVDGEQYILVQGTDNLKDYLSGYVIQRIDKLTRIEAVLTLTDHEDSAPNEV